MCLHGYPFIKVTKREREMEKEAETEKERAKGLEMEKKEIKGLNDGKTGKSERLREKERERMKKLREE